jgi:DNA modification methylase
MVADCVNDDLTKLFKIPVRIIATEPPYGVAYVENKKGFKKEGVETQISVDREIANDQLQTPEEYAEFTKKWLEKAVPHLADYNAAYIFNAELMFCALRKGMADAGFYYSQMIIWIKNSVVVGRKDYLPQHELIAYGWHGKHKFERSKGKTIMAVPEEVDPLIYQDKRSSSKLHPTMKPVGLMRKLILNSTQIGEVVYDPFGGSGSTLMACEHTKRKCYMVEIDPVYCDTIIARWEKLTGRKATLI